MIDHIISLGDIDIVTMSRSFFGAGPYDGTSDRSQKVNEVRANGTLWINSAGNYAQQHWNGTFTDTNSNNLVDFGTDDDINITVGAGKKIRLELTWDDPWGASSNNYDLYLRNSTNFPVALSMVNQTGSQNPREWIDYTTPVADTYHVEIKKSSGVAKELELFSLDIPLDEHNIASSSIPTPADASGALSVGAVDYDTEVLKSYSSRGPTNDGTIKPDVVGPTRVTATGYGTNGFAGTSASAPHVAGAAALILEANPSYIADQLQQQIELTTKNYHAKSNTDGTGLINSVNALFAFADIFKSDLSQWTELNEFDWNVESEAEVDVPGHDTANKVAHVDDCDTY